MQLAMLLVCTLAVLVLSTQAMTANEEILKMLLPVLNLAQTGESPTPLKSSYFLKGLDKLQLMTCTRCGGAGEAEPCTIAADAVCGAKSASGLVGDYDFSKGALTSLVANTPALVDVCNNEFKSTYTTATINGVSKRVLKVESGAGLWFDPTNQLQIGAQTTYTVIMHISVPRTNCYVRLLNVHDGNDQGFYICDSLMAYPTDKGGPNLVANTWYHIGISTDANRNMKLYLNGAMVKSWVKDQGQWDAGYKITTAAQKMVFFNDCGNSCRCNNGGGEQASALVSRMQIYNRVLEDTEVAKLYQAHSA